MAWIQVICLLLFCLFYAALGIYCLVSGIAGLWQEYSRRQEHRRNGTESR